MIDKFFGLLISLISGIYIASNLGPENYGILTYAIAIASLYSIINTLGIEGYSVKKISNNPTNLNRIIRLRFITSIFMVVFVIIHINSTTEDLTTNLLTLCFSLALFFNFLDTTDYFYQSNDVFIKGVIIRIIWNSISLFLKVLIIYYELGLVYFGFAAILASIFSFVLWYIYSPKKLVQKTQFDEISFSEILPLALSGLVVLIINNIDKIYLMKFFGSKEVGIISMGFNLVNAIYFIVPSVCSALYIKIIDSKKINHNAYENAMTLSYRIVIFMSVCLYFITPYLTNFCIKYILGSEYKDILDYINFIALLTSLNGIVLISSYWIIIENLNSLSFARNLLNLLLIIAALIFIEFADVYSFLKLLLISKIFAIFFIIFLSKRMRKNIKYIFDSINISKHLIWAKK